MNYLSQNFAGLSVGALSTPRPWLASSEEPAGRPRLLWGRGVLSALAEEARRPAQSAAVDMGHALPVFPSSVSASFALSGEPRNRRALSPDTAAGGLA